MIRAGLDGAEARAHETIVVGSGPAGLTLAMEHRLAFCPGYSIVLNS